MVARELDRDAQLALRERRQRRVRVGERPVGPRRELRRPRRYLTGVAALHVQPELLLQHGGRARSGAALVKGRAGASFRQLVLDAQHLAGPGDKDPPLLGALGHIPFIGGDANVPPRVRQVLADELPPPFVSGGDRHELARTAAPGIG